MITQFENGFITKNKLNELVDGINANTTNISRNSEDITDLDTRISLLEDLGLVVLTADITKTVGSGGDFTTLNLAIDWCKKVIPNGHEVELVIKSGYIFSEQMIYEDVNFGFITIKKESDVIYYADDSTFTTSFDVDGDVDRLPLFGFLNSVTPKFDILIRLQSTPVVNSCGLFLDKNSSSIIQSGIYSGFGNFYNSLYSRSSKLYAKGSNFSTNYGIGLYINNSECNISEMFFDMQNSLTDPVYICSNSTVEASFINIINAGRGIPVEGSSVVNMRDGKISSSSMASTSFISCSNSSNINLRRFSFTYIGTGYPKAVEVAYGGIVCAYGISTSGITNILSQTANTITSNGIIFK